ncbi:MAG: hypothetical protein LBD23_18505, partial [Oscillospiraceae bacterium]|nr:hypothetical protein [Oscillospiraceae bacterium]
MVGIIVAGNERNDSMQKEHFILEKSLRIEETLSRLFFKTEVLAALVRHGDGYIKDFDGIASLIVDDPAILNVLIAPDGIVTKVYSVYDDTSALLGHDFFADLSGNLEAMTAVETGELVMA